MWPHKEGLGIRLSYGVDGNGVLVVDSSDKKLGLKLEVAKLNQQGLVLNEIEGSHTLLSLPHNDTGSMLGASTSTFALPSTSSRYLDIPQCITNSYSSESVNISSSNSYDPTLGDLTSIFKLSSYRTDASHEVFAYRTGKSNNVLSLAVLKYNELKVKSSTDTEYQSKISDVSLSIQTKVSFSEKIAQICTCDLVHGQPSPYIIIRTSSTLYVLECSIKKKGRYDYDVSVSLIEELEATSNGLDYFADVCFNPYNFCQFAAVDVRGFFVIWNIDKAHQVPIEKMILHDEDVQFGIYDPAELSDWKRICWGKDMRSILISSRSSIYEFEFEPELRKKQLMTANTWSRIRDIYRLGNNAFLLTTKELIWFDVGENFTRKLSWRIFLDDQDPSVKLSVSSRNGRYVCLVYSQISPILFVYNFGIMHGIPFSLQDPYYIKRKHEDPVLQIQLLKLRGEQDQFFIDLNTKSTNTQGDFYGLIEFGSSGKSSITYYSEVMNLHINRAENDDIANQTKHVEEQYYYKFTRRMFSAVIANISHRRNQFSDELASIKKFAFYLGEGALKLISEKHDIEHRYYSLTDFFPTDLFRFKKINEFELMLQQLRGFYTSKEIPCFCFLDEMLFGRARGSNDLSHEGRLQHLKKEYFGESLLKSYNELDGFSSLLVTMSVALTKVKSTALSEIYSAQFNDSKKSTITEISNLIDLWDHDLDNDYLSGNSIITSKIAENETLQVNPSSVHLSQLPSTLNPTSQNTQIINQSSSQSDSQTVVNSQKRFPANSFVGSLQKKKKKKKGGFA